MNIEPVGAFGDDIQKLIDKGIFGRSNGMRAFDFANNPKLNGHVDLKPWYA